MSVSCTAYLVSVKMRGNTGEIGMVEYTVKYQVGELVNSDRSQRLREAYKALEFLLPSRQ